MVNVRNRSKALIQRLRPERTPSALAKAAKSSPGVV